MVCKETELEVTCFTDSDLGGSIVDRKSTSGVCAFIGLSLMSWFTKKQQYVALSTTEAEYVAVARACAQALWMKHTLTIFEVHLTKNPIMCDNSSP